MKKRRPRPWSLLVWVPLRIRLRGLKRSPVLIRSAVRRSPEVLAMAFDFDKVKNILVCPRTRKPLVLDGNLLVCTDPDQRHSYPILDDIPRLLADESAQLSPEEWRSVMERHNRSPETGEPLSAS